MSTTLARRLTRRSDPATSLLAAHTHLRSGRNASQNARILDALKAHPETCAPELATLAGLGRGKNERVSRRMSALRKLGLVEYLPPKIYRGRPYTCYRVIEPGQQGLGFET
jgi:predicted ArsR family transcriptional regulator